MGLVLERSQSPEWSGWIGKEVGRGRASRQSGRKAADRGRGVYGGKVKGTGFLSSLWARCSASCFTDRFSTPEASITTSILEKRKLKLSYVRKCVQAQAASRGRAGSKPNTGQRFPVPGPQSWEKRERESPEA